MKRLILGGILVAATLTGTLALTAGGASAGDRVIIDDSDDTSTEICYEDVEYVEYRFKQDVSEPTYFTEYRWPIETRTEKFEDIIEKETRTRTWTASIWQNFSPNRDQGTFAGPPSWPTDPRGTWQHRDKEIPGGHQGPDGVYQNGEGNGSWFYRAAGFWSEWEPWTDWPGAGPLTDDGRARGPLPHDSGDGWERQYRYVVVGESATSFNPKRYTDWTAAGHTVWGTSDTKPADTATTRYGTVDAREVEGEPDEFTLYYTGSDSKPSEDVEDAIWTESDPGEPWVEFDDRDGTREVEVVCPQPPPDVAKTEWVVGEYACDDTTVTQTRTVTTTPYIYVNGAWVLDVAKAVPTTETDTRPLSGVEFKACPTTTPPPPATPPVVVQIASQPPAVPPAAAPPAATPPAVVAATPIVTQLPSTGTSSWVMALIALAALAGGTGLMRLSRRPTS